jgi:hypothetical protein
MVIGLGGVLIKDALPSNGIIPQASSKKPGEYNIRKCKHGFHFWTNYRMGLFNDYRLFFTWFLE